MHVVIQIRNILRYSRVYFIKVCKFLEQTKYPSMASFYNILLSVLSINQLFCYRQVPQIRCFHLLLPSAFFFSAPKPSFIMSSSIFLLILPLGRFFLSVLLRQFSANFRDEEYGLSIWIFFFLYAPSILCFH